MPDFIELHSGQAFHPLSPDAEQIRIEDIAHALSHLCRFCGHTNTFYSVAEHSVRVARWLEEQGYGPQVVLRGLLHDASEYALSDISSPVKRTDAFAGYRSAEERLMSVICERFGLPEKEPEAVRKADLVLLATEAKCLMPYRKENWVGLTEEPLYEDIIPWSSAEAKRQFLLMFAAYYGRL